MKKITLYLSSAVILIALTITIFTSNAAVNGYIFSLMGWPVTPVEEAPIDNGFVISQNTLVPQTCIIRDFPAFQIGAIPPQTVWDTTAVIGIYILTDTVAPTGVTVSRKVISDRPIDGKITYDAQLGLLQYTASRKDVTSFAIEIEARSATNMITQRVEFNVMPPVQPSFQAFGLNDKKGAPTINPEEYVIVSERTIGTRFFNAVNQSIKEVCVAGMELVFDNNDSKIKYLSGQKNIRDLNLYAEKIHIRKTLYFPQTNVNIYCRELIIDDGCMIVTTPDYDPRVYGAWTEDGERGEYDYTREQGANGGTLGLYVGKLTAKSTTLFRLTGANGSNTTSFKFYCGNDCPGGWATEWRGCFYGGNGGNIISSIPLQPTMYDLMGGNPGTSSGAGSPATPGYKGSYIYEAGNKWAWLQPMYMRTVLNYLDNAYINLYNVHCYEKIQEYLGLIAECKESPQWATMDEEQQVGLYQVETELASMRFRLANDLDYFGYPTGWVPMLSLEVLMAVYDDEIDRSIRAMYLSYWLNNVAKSQAEKVAAAVQAAEQAKAEYTSNVNALSSLQQTVSDAYFDLNTLKDEVKDVENSRAILENSLAATAFENIRKENEKAKTFGVFKAIISIAAPAIAGMVGGPGAASVVSGITGPLCDGIGKIANVEDRYKVGEDIQSIYSTVGAMNEMGAIDDMTGLVNGFRTDTISKNKDKALGAAKGIAMAAGPLFGSIQSMAEKFASTTIPQDQIDAELNRLAAGNPAYQGLVSDIKKLNIRKGEVQKTLISSMNQVTQTSAALQSNIMAINTFTSESFKLSAQRDVATLQYLNAMENRAKKRLMNYHYMMARAYEYRLMKTYPGEINLTKLFDRIKAIAAQGSTNGTLTSTQFADLKTIYEEPLSAITQGIVDELASSNNKMQVPLEITLGQDELNELNRDGGMVTMNMVQRGYLPTSEENVRIDNIEVFQMEVKKSGTSGSADYFDLNIEHPGISVILNRGELYWFNHRSRETNNSFYWGTRYQAGSESLTAHKQSPSDKSLLYTLMQKKVSSGQLMSNIQLTSNPGAWADLQITRNLMGRQQLDITKLVLKVTYQYSRAESSRAMLRVNAEDLTGNMKTISPFISVSRDDLTSRNDGRAFFVRTYSKSTSTKVTLTAPERYGALVFDKWGDYLTGKTLSTNRVYEVTMSNDQNISAMYKYADATMDVANRINYDSDSQMDATFVKNSGSKSFSWESATSAPWISIINGKKGVDSEYIVYKLDQNNTKTERSGVISVTSPEVTTGSKQITIVQAGNPNSGIEQLEQATEMQLNVTVDPLTKQGKVVFIEGEKRFISITVFAINGQAVVSTQGDNTDHVSFNLSHCPQGAYIVKVIADGKVTSRKITL